MIEPYEPTQATAENPLGDDRFSKMFTSADYQMDDKSSEFALRYGPLIDKGGGMGRVWGPRMVLSCIYINFKMNI